MLVFGSRQCGPAINFYKAPFRHAKTILGNATPPTSPQTFATPFGEFPTAGNQYFLKLITLDPTTDTLSIYQFVTALVT